MAPCTTLQCLFALPCLVATVLAGCAAPSRYDRATPAYEPRSFALQEDAAGGALASERHRSEPGGRNVAIAPTGSRAESPADPAQPQRAAESEARLVIYTASFALLVSNPEDATRTFLKRVDGIGGHMQALKGTAVTVRVPAARFSEVLEWLPEMGRVVARQVDAEDVTRAVGELKLRMENAERSRERLLALLAKAERMEDILKLEKEIARVTEQVELLRAELRGMNDRIALSTVTVEFRSVAPEIRPVARREYSPFPWINRVGAEHALRD